jgi:hypothetical protein
VSYLVLFFSYIIINFNLLEVWLLDHFHFLECITINELCMTNFEILLLLKKVVFNASPGLTSQMKVFFSVLVSIVGFAGLSISTFLRKCSKSIDRLFNICIVLHLRP